MDFDLTGLLEDFLAVSMSALIQIFQKLILKKKSNNLIPKSKYDLKDLTSLLRSLLNYKLRQNFCNKIGKFSKIEQYKKSLISTFQCFLTVIEEI